MSKETRTVEMVMGAQERISKLVEQLRKQRDSLRKRADAIDKVITEHDAEQLEASQPQQS